MINPLKILIFGKNSIITREFVNSKFLNLKAILIIRSVSVIKKNIINEKKILKVIENFNPNFILNNISIKDIKYCEKKKFESFLINTKFSNILNNISIKKKIYYIFFSTASLFERYKSNKPFNVNTRPKFKNYYSKTKLLAENKIKINKRGIIIRISNLYSQYTKNFIYRICFNIKKNKKIMALHNCYFTPVNAKDLVNFFVKKISTNPSYYSKKKIIHFSENNHQTRYNFFLKVEKNVGLKRNIKFKFCGLKKFLNKI